MGTSICCELSLAIFYNLTAFIRFIETFRKADCEKPSCTGHDDLMITVTTHIHIMICKKFKG